MENKINLKQKVQRILSGFTSKISLPFYFNGSSQKLHT